MRLAALLICSAVGALGIASTAGAVEASRETANARVIKVFVANITWNEQHKPPAGRSGDAVIATDRLENAVPQFGKPKGAIVGRTRYRGLFLTAEVATLEVTATLPGGTVHARGRVDFRLASDAIRVDGGTGAFAGTTGTMEQRFIATNDRTMYVFTLHGG